MKEECCPKFNPKLWDNKNHNWKSKPFIIDSMPTFFHIPFTPMIGIKMSKLWNLAKESKKISPNKDKILILFHDPSSFKSEILVSVTGNVKEANNIKLTGNFFSKVYSGEYNEVPKFIKMMSEYLSNQGKNAKDFYIHYAYCPKCAKKYGNNYMIFFAKIK